MANFAYIGNLNPKVKYVIPKADSSTLTEDEAVAADIGVIRWKQQELFEEYDNYVIANSKQNDD